MNKQVPIANVLRAKFSKGKRSLSFFFFLSFRKSALQMCSIHPFFSWVLHSFLDKEWHKQFSQNRKFSITNKVQKIKSTDPSRPDNCPFYRVHLEAHLNYLELRGELASSLRAKDKKLKLWIFWFCDLVYYFDNLLNLFDFYWSINGNYLAKWLGNLWKGYFKSITKLL